MEAFMMVTRTRPRRLRLTVERLEDRNLLDSTTLVQPILDGGAPGLDPQTPTVTVDLTRKYQSIYGFGAGMKREVDELYNMQEPYRTQVLNLMFHDVDTRI